MEQSDASISATSKIGKRTNNNRNTNSSTQLPKTGLDTKIYVAIILVVILIVFFGIKYENLKDVK